MSHARSSACEIAIVGGGIVGAACAFRLARAGARVVILEAGPLGGGATAAGMGHVVALDDSPAQLALTAASRKLWHALLPELPAHAEADVCGTLWVAADAEEMAAVQRKHLLLKEAGIQSHVLSAAALAKEEPQLRRGLAGGLLVPDDLVVFPPSVTEYLVTQAVAAGAELRRVAVRKITPDGRVKCHDGSLLHADVVINATGCAAPSLTPGLRVRPRKGHLVITDRYPGFVHHQLIELGYLKSAHAAEGESVAFNIQPRKTGQLLIGSSRQFDVEGTDVEMRLVNKMVQRAVLYLPAITDLSAIRIWTGHRAATPDKLPLIGPIGGESRVWLATGHEGLGITTSLITAQLLTDLWRGQTSELDGKAYLPTRRMKD